ncbi:MAG: S1C family serine protease [Promethearchaeota archaeon]
MPKRIITICIVMLLAFNTVLNAQLAQFTLVTHPGKLPNHILKAGIAAGTEQVKIERGYMGVGIILDRTPLPDLLRKHLGLSPDQGIRIINVYRDSPADKAGLERDDIIIGFQGKDLNSNNALVNAVRQAGIGAEVSLEIIHLGQRKTVKLKLEASKGKVELKYPREPESEVVWRPGKAYKLKQDEGKWIEVPFEDLPGDLDFNITMPFGGDGMPELLNEVYLYHFSQDNETYTITINGNPAKDDTKIIVRVGESEYKTEIGAIDKLPEKYRASVEESIGKARKTSQERIAEQKVNTDKKENFPSDHPVQPTGPDEKVFVNIEKQMREFQNRLAKLEEQQKNFFERLSDKLEKQESQGQ